MNIQILLSTMNKKNIKDVEQTLKRMKVTKSALVINQITTKINTFSNEGQHHIICKEEKGLSKSRNLAIQNFSGDVGIIADDDIVYEEDYYHKIEKAYRTHPDADIIAFYVESKNKKRPTKKQKTHRVNWITAMRISSFQITIKKGIYPSFDEEFGAGTKYLMGEESIFLYDCLRQNKKIYYIDEKIATAEQKESTWFKGYNKEYFKAEGAIFYRISSLWYIPLILQFGIRKHNKWEANIKQTINWMLEGAREYKNGRKSKCYHTSL